MLLPHPTPNHLILRIASPTEESLVICNIIHRVVLLECINWPFYVTSHYNTVIPLCGVHLPNISMGVRCLTTMRNFAHMHDYGNIEKLQSNWRHTVRDAVIAPCITSYQIGIGTGYARLPPTLIPMSTIMLDV